MVLDIAAAHEGFKDRVISDIGLLEVLKIWVKV